MLNNGTLFAMDYESGYANVSHFVQTTESITREIRSKLFLLKLYLKIHSISIFINNTKEDLMLAY